MGPQSAGAIGLRVNLRVNLQTPMLEARRILVSTNTWSARVDAVSQAVQHGRAQCAAMRTRRSQAESASGYSS